MRSNAELQNITEWLLRHQVSESDVRKFLGGNLMRLFDAVWK
jgi:microsomal dipeptidase-like Zn-dependent dipeptidase